MNFVVAHKNGHFAELPTGLLHWKTCVRHLVFAVDKQQVSALDADEIFEGPAAYQFCLEVLCGLRSPLIGETEIFGQFKEFCGQPALLHSDIFASHRAWFEQLVSDTKKVRQRHLIGLGSQSYGSLLRRYTKGLSDLHVLGSGHLVEEILPWVEKEPNQVKVYARNETKRQRLSERFSIRSTHSLDELKGNSGALVVAAPLKTEQIVQMTQQNEFQLILDMRGEAKADPIPSTELKVVDLPTMFAEISENRERISQQISNAYNLVLSLAQKHANHIQVRPFGWDDLCAYG